MESRDNKFTLARQLIQRDGVCISIQVLNEVCRNLLRRANYSEDELKETIQQFTQHTQIHLLSVADSLQASQLREDYALSYWDSLVVAAAQAEGCHILYSEDMQHQQRIDSLTIINPFKL